MIVYPGIGTIDGIHGDHVILAPSYIVTKKDVNYIVNMISAVVQGVYNKINTE
jgi:adenosylmethionine-8-amino-7-oxononanoate aminotransferase